MKERKLRFTVSIFRKIARRQRHQGKLVQDLLAQKPILTAVMEYGKKNMNLWHLGSMRSFLRKMGKPVTVLRSGLFVCPKIPVLGCSPNAKITDLNCKHCFGLREVKCPFSKFNFTPLDACDRSNVFLRRRRMQSMFKKGTCLL